MDELLIRVKKNLNLEHDADDDIVAAFILSAISYAEGYQHLPAGVYKGIEMSEVTKQGIVMLATHFYESRDGGTGGFFADNPQASKQSWDTIHLLLRLDRDWKV